MIVKDPNGTEYTIQEFRVRYKDNAGAYSIDDASDDSIGGRTLELNFNSEEEVYKFANLVHMFYEYVNEHKGE